MNKLQTIRASIGTALLSAVALAHAELPAAATTAVNDYKTDALAAIGLVMGAGIAIWGLRKLAGKMGWF